MYKKKYVFFCFLLLLILGACSSKKQNKRISNKETVLLHSSDSLPLSIGLPTQMAYSDDKLFLVDMFAENKLVTVYDLQKNDTLLSFGQKGEGPYEYLQINSIDVYKNDKGRLMVSVFDPSQSKLGVYDYDSLLELKSLYIPTILSAKAVGFSLHEILKTSKGYLATGMTTTGKYIALNNNLSVSNIFGKYREKPIKSIPDMSNVLANYGKTVFSDDRSSFVEIVYNASALSCYKLGGDSANLQWENVIHDLDYKMEGASVINKAPMGYLSACFVGDNVYALYSGEMEDEDEIATYGKEIHKYDNKGHIVAEYHLDKSAFAFCIDKMRGKLYVLSHKPEPAIWVYDIAL